MNNVIYAKSKKGKATMKEGRSIPNLEALFQVGGHNKYKVVQLCYGVFGQGTTFDEACEDAVEWIESVSNAEEVKALLVERHEALDGDMTMLNIDDHEDFHDYQVTS